MLKTDKVAIARVSFQLREHLCCLRPTEDSIILHTLYYQDEILPHTELAPQAQELKKEELEMAISLVKVLSKDFDPSQYHDEYRVALQALIEARIRGKAITPLPEAAAEIPNLMATMRASLLAAKKGNESVKDEVSARKKS